MLIIYIYVYIHNIQCQQYVKSVVLYVCIGGVSFRTFEFFQHIDAMIRVIYVIVCAIFNNDCFQQ